MLNVSHVTKSYQGQPTLSNVSLHVAKAERVALIGPSGVGKTTLFNIINGLSRPDCGQVFLGGFDVTGQMGKIGYMQQKDLLLPHLTMIQNVILPMTINGQKKEAAVESAMPMLEKFGLTDAKDKYPHQLSGGMRQRAALLRTYFFGGELFLLDEPFSALDGFTKAQLHRWFLSITEELGLGALIVTHDMDEAASLATRIYVMEGPVGHISREITGTEAQRRESLKELMTWTA